MTISVFLLDDHELVRRGLADLLEVEHDGTVVGEAGTAAQALSRVPTLRPDVAVRGVDIVGAIRTVAGAVRCSTGGRPPPCWSACGAAGCPTIPATRR